MSVPAKYLGRMKEDLFFLLKRNAFFKRRVRLSSGKISNYYIDVRRVSLTSRGLYLISHLIWEEVKKDDISAIGGPTLGADPLVSGVCMVAYNQGKELRGFLVRKESKKYGQKRLIEGSELKEGERVVLVDDVATTGASLVKVIRILKKQKVEVVKTVVVVDRKEGAEENLAKCRCPLISIFTNHDFLEEKKPDE